MSKVYIPKKIITRINGIARVKNEKDSLIGLAFVFSDRCAMLERFGTKVEYIEFDESEFEEIETTGKATRIENG